MKKFYIFATLAAPILLAGCAPYDVGYGNSVKQNIALQVINPEPQYKGDVQPGGSGDRAATAIERYREGKVIQPATALTTTSISKSGSGQGAGVGTATK